VNESLDRLESLFAATLEKPPAKRAAYLDQACADEPALRERVEALLRAQVAAGSFLENPAAQTATTGGPQDVAETASSGEAPGAMVGPYKLIEQIGEGGMGAVWLAQQTEPVKRLVAVKLIKAGMDSKQVIARFDAERQALALMDHAHIARVLEAGTTDAGRPYFVMDLVKGMPITRYCDDHHLTPRQRLELFIPVCQAVQHAHQKGVIHRDLKPSNVLVALYDGKPVPKVIDFGVAKAAGQSLTEKTLVTGFGNIVGTLEYMSPEQAEINQLDIDTRSDIYSLGVLLYELLTGSPPFSRKDLERAGILEMLRVIREQEPTRPSTKLSTANGLPTLAANRGTEPAKLAKLIRGELDWIVMKALEKDRNRRYESANGFAMDLQRYLADEPVQACPPSASYRLRKFARRNRAAVGSAIAVAAAVMLGAVVAAWQAIAANRARAALAVQHGQLIVSNARERQRFELAREAISAFHTGVAEDVLLKQEEFEPLRKKLLSGAADFYRRLEQQLGAEGDPRSQSALADAYSGLAKVSYDVGSTDQALQDFKRAVGIYEAHAADDPGVRRALVRVLIRLYQVHDARHDPVQTLSATATRAVEEAEKLVGGDPNDLESSELLVETLILLGTSNHNNRQVELFGRAAGLSGSLLKEKPSSPKRLRLHADALFWQASVFMTEGKYEESVPLFRRVVQTYESACQEGPPTPDLRLKLADSRHTLGWILGSKLGQVEQSLDEYRRMSQIVEELVAEQPAVVLYQQRLADAHQNICWALWSVGRIEESHEAARRQLAILQALVTRHPDRPTLKSSLARAFYNTASTQCELGRTDEAQANYRRALELWEALMRDHAKASSIGLVASEFVHVPVMLAGTLEGLGIELARIGKNADATAAFQRAAEIAETHVKTSPDVSGSRERLIQTLGSLGSHLVSIGRSSDGRNQLERAREFAGDHPSNQARVLLGGLSYKSALAFRDTGDETRSLLGAQQALTTFEQFAREQPGVVAYRQAVARSLALIGLAHQRAGRPREGRVALERSRDVFDQLVSEVPRLLSYRDDLGSTLTSLGRLESLAGNADAGIELHSKAVALREQVVAEAPKDTNFQRALASSLTYLGQAQRRLGRHADASAALERALGLVEPLLKLRVAVPLVQEVQLLTRLELGMLRVAQGRNDEAGGHFANAITTAAEQIEMSVDGVVCLAAVHAQVSKLPDGVVAAAFAGQPNAASGKENANRATHLLNTAVKKGFGDLPHMRSDGFAPLRERDDFKQLVGDLEDKKGHQNP
jgi:eukaryotic-like serine/threonine-protein kinase